MVNFEQFPKPPNESNEPSLEEAIDPIPIDAESLNDALEGISDEGPVFDETADFVLTNADSREAREELEDLAVDYKLLGELIDAGVAQTDAGEPSDELDLRALEEALNKIEGDNPETAGKEELPLSVIDYINTTYQNGGPMSDFMAMNIVARLFQENPNDTGIMSKPIDENVKKEITRITRKIIEDKIDYETKIRSKT